jgi:hypothetical protein
MGCWQHPGCMHPTSRLLNLVKIIKALKGFYARVYNAWSKWWIDISWVSWKLGSCSWPSVCYEEKNYLWDKHDIHRITKFLCLFLLSGVFGSRNTMFRKLGLFLSSGEGVRRHLLSWETDPVSETCFYSQKHRMMERVQNPSNSVCYTPSSEP